MAYEEYTQPTPSKWVSVGGTTKQGVKNPVKIEGYYLRSETGPDKFNPGQDKTNIILRTKEGVVGVNCSKNLAKQLKEAEGSFLRRNGRPALGASMLITFPGLKDTGKGNPMKTYTLQFDKDNFIEVDAGFEATTTADEEDTYESEVTDSYDDVGEEELQQEPLVIAKPPVTRKSVMDVLKSRQKSATR